MASFKGVPSRTAGEIVGRERAGAQQDDRQRVAQRHHGGGAAGRGKPQRAGFLRNRCRDVDVGITRHRRTGAGGDADKRNVFAFERGDDGGDFVAFAGIGNGDDHVVVHNHPQIAVCRFRRVDEKRGRAGRSHGCRYFAPDVSRLAHTRDDDPARAAQQRVCRKGEVFVQIRRNFAQAFRFGVQHFARPIEIFSVSCHRNPPLL